MTMSMVWRMDTRPPPPPIPTGRQGRPITLALEGGGALGAFTWGVLERLLDETSLRIEVVSGTSAGAMNGAMLVQGLAEGGPARAQALLATFWQRVSISAGSLPGPSGAWLQMIAESMAPMLDAVRKAGSAMGAHVGAFGLNPLRGILSELLHTPLFGQEGAPELVVAATKVRTGEAKLFRGGDVSLDALLASGCLPQVFPAIEIDGEAYWDGGYSSNPPVRPLIEAGCPGDVLIVRTTPSERHMMPHGAAAVKDRVNEITFGSPLRAELRSLALAQASLSEMAALTPALTRLRDARLHMISPAGADEAAASETLQPSWPLFSEQRRRGAAAAERWLEANLAAVGHRSSLPMNEFTGRETGATGAPRSTRRLEEATHAT